MMQPSLVQAQMADLDGPSRYWVAGIKNMDQQGPSSGPKAEQELWPRPTEISPVDVRILALSSDKSFAVALMARPAVAAECWRPVAREG